MAEGSEIFLVSLVWNQLNWIINLGQPRDDFLGDASQSSPVFFILKKSTSQSTLFYLRSSLNKFSISVGFALPLVSFMAMPIRYLIIGSLPFLKS